MFPREVISYIYPFIMGNSPFYPILAKAIVYFAIFVKHFCECSLGEFGRGDLFIYNAYLLASF